jgi:hypothetical protein
MVLQQTKGVSNMITRISELCVREDNMVRFELALDKVVNTDGSGYWSKACKGVRVLGVTLAWEEGSVSGDLGVAYDKETWDNATDGLIYTDEGFIAGVQALLIAAGLDADAVACIGYSEQGMQDDGRVSCDANELHEWLVGKLAEDLEEDLG